MNDLMIDIETAGKRPGAAILTIAAVWFDAEAAPMEETRKFEHADPAILYERVELQSCLNAGLTVDADTLTWWMTQTVDARDEAFMQMPRVTLASMAQRLSGHFNPGQKQYGNVWSHGASFDIPIVEAALAAVGYPIPWQYSNIRDTRTLYQVAAIDRTSPPLKHHAVFDALAQARDVQRAFEKLRA